MNSSPTIFNISSGEEQALEDLQFGDDDYKLLSGLLKEVDISAPPPVAACDGDDDSDDVVVIEEWNPSKPKSKSTSKSKSLKPLKDVDGGDDDDCMVLDANPENPVTVTDNCSSGDGEDVLCVGQKGEIACRDLPHLRHLCAKFPFSSTPHYRHCDLCYCYVCDSPAPCALWAVSVSNTDHCHATDKILTWKTLRESFRNLKLQKDASLDASKFSDSPLSVSVDQCNQVAPHGIMRSASNSVTQNHVSRQPTIRACSSTRSGNINVISQDRNRLRGRVQGRHRFMLGVRNNVVRRDRGPNISNFGQQFLSPNTMLEKPVTIGCTFQTNNTVYGSSNSFNCAPASQCTRNLATLAPSNDKYQAYDLSYAYWNLNAHQSYLQPNVSSAIADGVSSLHEVCIQSPQSNGCQNLCHLGNSSPDVADSGFHDLGTGSINSTTLTHVPADDIGFHETGCDNEPNEPSILTQFNYQFNGNAQLHHKEHEYEGWSTNQYVPVASDGCVPSLLGVFSPGSFDYESSSWNGLTHS